MAGFDYTTRNLSAQGQGTVAPPNEIPDDEFFEILKKGIRLSDPVLSNILQVHLPMVLGSVGSPVGALAGAILSGAGKLAKQSSLPVNDFRQGLPYDGILERAILGEAAFSAVISMKRRRLEDIGVLSEMAKVVKQISPATKEIAPFIMHTLTAPALRIALNSLYNNAEGSNAKPTFAISSGTSFAQHIGTLDSGAETFFRRLSASCAKSGGGQESSRILQIGFREAGPILTTDGYEGLQVLATILPDTPSSGVGIPDHHPFIDGLPERAMLGEAALQALMKVPMQHLDESTFENMAQCVARIGQVVIQSAHGLIEDIGFAVKGILAIPLATSAAIPAASANGYTAESNFFVSSASRRDKGVSYVNLEREVLDYYRGLDTKVQPANGF